MVICCFVVCAFAGLLVLVISCDLYCGVASFVFSLCGFGICLLGLLLALFCERLAQCLALFGGVAVGIVVGLLVGGCIAIGFWWLVGWVFGLCWVWAYCGYRLLIVSVL